MDSDSRQAVVTMRVWDFLVFRALANHGRVRINLAQIASTISLRRPSERRPTIGEVNDALHQLRREGRIRPAAVYGRSVWVVPDKQGTLEGHIGPPAGRGATESAL